MTCHLRFKSHRANLVKEKEKTSKTFAMNLSLAVPLFPTDSKWGRTSGGVYVPCESTRMPGESYRRRLRSLLLYLCYVFRALINSLVCLLCTSAVGLVIRNRGNVLCSIKTKTEQYEWKHRWFNIDSIICQRRLWRFFLFTRSFLRFSLTVTKVFLTSRMEL